MYSARHMNARVSPQKARLVADLIRGRRVADALLILRHSQVKSAALFEKVLQSALSNAEFNFGADVDALKVSSVSVDKGPKLRRFQARAKGRGSRIEKPTAHINVVLE